MIPDRIVWKTLTSHVPNPSHTHINRTRSLRLALRSLFHINKWRRTRAPFPFSYHKHTCSHLHVDATHAFTTYRSIYEPHDTVQNGRFTHTVTHTHTHTHTYTHTLLKEGLMILNLLPLRRVYWEKMYYPHEKVRFKYFSLLSVCMVSAVLCCVFVCLLI